MQLKVVQNDDSLQHLSSFCFDEQMNLKMTLELTKREIKSFNAVFGIHALVSRKLTW